VKYGTSFNDRLRIRCYYFRWGYRQQKCETFFINHIKVKAKVHPTTGHEDPEREQMYSSTVPSTSALDGGEWSTPRPGRFTPGKDPVSIAQEAGWATGPV